jgi:hypothetical protein
MTALIADLEKIQQGVGGDIQRLQAGASSIMSSVNDADPAAAISVRRRATEDIGTGIHLPLGKWISSAAWTILLCAVIFAGVWAYLNRETLFNEAPLIVRTVPTPTEETAASPTQNVAAAKQPSELFKQARELLAGDAVSPRAEEWLRKITDSFPAAPEAEPAKNLLAQLETEKKKIKTAQLAALLKEAKAFETQQPAAYEEIIKRYRQIKDEAGDAAQDAAAEAQRAIQDAERRRADEQARTAEAVFATAKNKAEAALKERDFDGAAVVWRDFLARHGASNKRAEADYEARRVEAAADKAYEELEERALAAEKRATAGGWAAALKLWDDWLNSVKAVKHRDAVETARKTLADRAEKFYTEESAKLFERARLYQYDWALEYIRGVSEKLADTEWGKQVAELEDRLNRSKQLHKTVLDAIAAKVKESGAVPLPFNFVIPRMEMIKQWAICGAGPDRLELEAVPKNVGPGVSRKFADLTPEQQYQAYRLFLPAKLSPDLEKSLAAFCAERGLTSDGKPNK